MRKRVLALLLVTVMFILGSWWGMTRQFVVHAAEPDESRAGTVEETYVNPIYQDVVSEEDLTATAENGIATYAEPEYETDESVQNIASIIRENMIQRESIITVYYKSEQEYDNTKLKSWVELAMAETEDSHAGDYLRWTYAGYKASISYSSSQGMWYYTYTINMTYYTTAEQEAELDAALTSLLAELGVRDAGMADYDKVKKIYDYICSNVTYDYDNLDDDTYKLKYTAYAALIHKTAVCQGYAALVYRMMEDAGVDTRLVSGTGGGGAHGWNIVKLGSRYYYLDSTWDAGNKTYRYFLKGTSDFSGHTPESAFLSSYALADTAYAVTGMTLERTALELRTGDIDTLAVAIEPDGSGEGESVTWSSSNETVAVVDGQGTVTAVGVGQAVITAKAAGRLAQCTVNVTELPEVTSIKAVLTENGAEITWGAVDGADSYHISVAEAMEDGTPVWGDLIGTSAKCSFLYSWDDIRSDCEPEVLEGHEWVLRYSVAAVSDGEIIARSRLYDLTVSHAWSEEYTIDQEATCTEAGSESIHCSVCDEVKENSAREIPMKEHSWDSGRVTTEATCTADGEKTYTCTVCKKTRIEKIEATGHIWNEEYTIDQEATCTAVGSESIHCSVCDEVKENSAREIPMKEHSWDSGKVTEEATCTADGEKTFTCRDCGITRTETISATGHAYGEWQTVKEATTAEEGYKKRVCSKCGDEEIQSIPKLPGSEWKQNSKGWWYENPDGTYPTSCWMQIDGSWYYFSASGYRMEGWQKIKNIWYYFDPETGIMYEEQWLELGGKKYYLNSSGAMATGWLELEEGWYYLNGSGVRVTGWLSSGGKWYYLNPLTGVMLEHEWLVLNGSNYYLESDGAMATGWLKLDDKWYYLNSSGARLIGWQKIGSVWYYFEPSTGIMLEQEWLEDTYYLKSGGAMAMGWQKIGEDYYYFTSGGKKVTGKWVGNYYLLEDGVMATGQWVDQGRYYVDESGKWVPGMTP
ncbi:transglutaminase domain-containing protein [Faecalicatena contorta]|uniref:transglutaminase domain-containing protein n=1 Tax=Faecalicatena contorta TaxID=39482 RepID=UPI001F42F550|nr:transglutaminase domain-containing protein [Faecalicatena contorta]MCF2681490.1 Ig-like domain-containing protein [Faecalicatena contorta]